MPRFQFHAIFAGATAIALVMAPAHAQQAAGQQGGQQGGQHGGQHGGQQGGQQTSGQSDQASGTRSVAQSGTQPADQVGPQVGQQVDPQSGQQGGMDTGQIVTLIEEHIDLARTALDADSVGDARQALQHAAEELALALEDQGQPPQAWQDLQDRLTEALDALDNDDLPAARDALDRAGLALADLDGNAAPASAQGQASGGQPADGTTSSAGSASVAGTPTGQSAGTSGQGQQASTGSEAEPQVSGGQQAATDGSQAATTNASQTGAGAQVSTGGQGQQASATVQQANGQPPAGNGGQVNVEVRESTEGTSQDPATAQVRADETVTVNEGETVETRAAQPQPDAAVEAEVVSGSDVPAQQGEAILGADGQPLAPPSEMLTVAPTEIEGRDVVTFDGGSVGEVDSVVLSGGEVHAIVAHGGFLGIGRDRVAVPVTRLGVRGEEIVLLDLTEEQLDALPEFDLQTGQAVPAGRTLEVGRYE